MGGGRGPESHIRRGGQEPNSLLHLCVNLRKVLGCFESLMQMQSDHLSSSLYRAIHLNSSRVNSARLMT